MEKRFHKGVEGEVRERWDRLDIPLKVKKPIVWCVWNDLAHEEITLGFFGSVIGRIAEYQRHTFLVLTKRPERLIEFMSVMCLEWRSLPNLWLGVTVVNQAEADEKIPLLLQTPAAHRWISIEPMLEPINLSNYGTGTMIDAVILGGETGPGARPMNPDWVRTVRDQCADASVPFFFKQWGKHMPPLKDVFGDRDILPATVFFSQDRHLDGREHNDLPWRSEPYLCREHYPATRSMGSDNQ